MSYPYAPSYRERVTARVAEGYRVAEVAREFGVPHETVRRWCVAAGVHQQSTYRQHTMPTRRRVVARVRDGESMTAVAKDENLTFSVVQAWCKAEGVTSRHWSFAARKAFTVRKTSARRETAVRAVRESGLSKAAAGRMVGVSATAVRQWLRQVAA
jgi:transposase-like protein